MQHGESHIQQVTQSRSRPHRDLRLSVTMAQIASASSHGTRAMRHLHRVTSSGPSCICDGAAMSHSMPMIAYLVTSRQVETLLWCFALLQVIQDVTQPGAIVVGDLSGVKEPLIVVANRVDHVPQRGVAIQRIIAP